MDYTALVEYFSTLQSLLLLLLLAVLRLAPIVSLAPFYGGQITPPNVKAGLAVAMAILFLPQLIAETNGEPLAFNGLFLAYSVKELGIGVALALLISIPFWTASSSGSLIDYQRGAMSLMVFNPAMRVQTSPLGNLFNYVLVINFFMIGGPALFFDAVASSYQLIPPNRLINPLFFSSSHTPFWHVMIIAIAQVLRIAAQLAAPPLVAMFLSDLFLGIANRLAQQVPIGFLGWALKSLIGMGVLWAAWFFILRQLNIEMVNWLKVINRLIDQSAPLLQAT